MSPGRPVPAQQGSPITLTHRAAPHPSTRPPGGPDSALLRPQSYATCALGIHFVGYVMICFSATNSLCSELYGKVSQYTGRIPLYAFGRWARGHLPAGAGPRAPGAAGLAPWVCRGGTLRRAAPPRPACGGRGGGEHGIARITDRKALARPLAVGEARGQFLRGVACTHSPGAERWSFQS